MPPTAPTQFVIMQFTAQGQALPVHHGYGARPSLRLRHRSAGATARTSIRT